MNKRLYRSNKDKVLAGVCGGIAEYFKIDVTIVRLIVVLLAFPSFGITFFGYIIGAIIIPERPLDYVEVDDGEDVEVDMHTTIDLDSKDTRRVLGILLIGIGALILMSKLFVWFDSGMIIAIAIITIGVFIIKKKN
ncbi:PspC domain-containing protein [Petrocella sp. FN5]|nr:PspC domain-containing protein [Petrocella sp. FN5]MDF1617340.1 PspC domain-containing protein [Petrocella sp. FN5]